MRLGKVGFILLVVCVFVRADAVRCEQQQVAPAVKDHSASDDPSPFGFSCDNQTTYTLASYCPQMAKAGLRWIRGFPTFNVIEPEQGRFDWSSVDAHDRHRGEEQDDDQWIVLLQRALDQSQR